MMVGDYVLPNSGNRAMRWVMHIYGERERECKGERERCGLKFQEKKQFVLNPQSY